MTFLDKTGGPVMQVEHCVHCLFSAKLLRGRRVDYVIFYEDGVEIHSYDVAAGQGPKSEEELHQQLHSYMQEEGVTTC